MAGTKTPTRETAPGAPDKAPDGAVEAPADRRPTSRSTPPAPRAKEAPPDHARAPRSRVKAGLPGDREDRPLANVLRDGLRLERVPDRSS